MRSPTWVVPGRVALVGSGFRSLACFSLLLRSAMSMVSGNIAANARAASLSANVMAKRRSPTVIHMLDSFGWTVAAEVGATVAVLDDPGWAAPDAATTSRPT